MFEEVSLPPGLTADTTVAADSHGASRWDPTGDLRTVWSGVDAFCSSSPGSEGHRSAPPHREERDGSFPSIPVRRSLTPKLVTTPGRVGAAVRREPPESPVGAMGLALKAPASSVVRVALPSTGAAPVSVVGVALVPPRTATPRPGTTGVALVPAPAVGVAPPLAATPSMASTGVAPLPAERVASSVAVMPSTSTGAAAAGVTTPSTRVRKLGALAASRERDLQDTEELHRVTLERWAEEEKAHEEKVREEERVHKARIRDQWSVFRENEKKLKIQSDMLRDEEERFKLVSDRKVDLERESVAEEDRLRAAKLRSSQLESEQRFLQSRVNDEKKKSAAEQDRVRALQADVTRIEQQRTGELKRLDDDRLEGVRVQDDRAAQLRDIDERLAATLLTLRKVEDRIAEADERSSSHSASGSGHVRLSRIVDRSPRPTGPSPSGRSGTRTLTVSGAAAAVTTSRAPPIDSAGGAALRSPRDVSGGGATVLPNSSGVPPGGGTPHGGGVPRSRGGTPAHSPDLGALPDPGDGARDASRVDTSRERLPSLKRGADLRRGGTGASVKREPVDRGDSTRRDASVASPHRHHHRRSSSDRHHGCRRHRRDSSRHRSGDASGNRAAPGPRPATDARTTSGLRASMDAAGAARGGAAAGGGGSSPGGAGDDRGGGTPRRPRDSRRRSGAPSGPGGPGGPGDSGSGSSSCSSRSSSSSSDSDSEVESAERKRLNKEIDSKRKGVFVITSEKLRKAKKNKSRNNMRCEVEKFARGTDVNIVEWIMQMETFFGISSLKPDAYVGYMMQRILHPYFKEVSVHKELEYLDFREKLVEIFGEPDMATARLHELKKAEQQYGETISEYMNRLRLLVLRAHPDLAHKDRDRILTTEFISGLRDQKLSMALSMASIQSSADAERKATEGDSVRKNAKSKKAAYTHCMPEQPEEQLGDPYEEAEGAVGGAEDLTAAFGEQRGGRGGAFVGRPFRGFGGRGRGGAFGVATRGAMRGSCYSCGVVGHYQSNCPKRQGQVAAPSAPIVCSFCRGPHPVRLCTKYAASLRDVAKPNAMMGTQDARASNTGGAAAPVASRPAVQQQKQQQNLTSFLNEEVALPVLPSLEDLSEGPDGDMAMPGVESVTATPRLFLFFLQGNIQNYTCSILIDSGSVRNLIDDRIFGLLPYQPPLKPRDIRVFGGNGQALKISGFVVLPVVICGELLWHEFGVVSGLPVRVIIGADILIPHRGGLKYVDDTHVRLKLKKSECTECLKNKELPQEGESVQMRYVSRNIRVVRNRQRLDDEFIAVLPLDGDSARMVSAKCATPEISEVCDATPGATPLKIQSQLLIGERGGATSATSGSEVVELRSQQRSTGITPEVGGGAILQKGKFQHVLSELKVSSLSIPESLKKCVIGVVRECIDSFAATPDDFGRTNVSMHTIKTGEAKPFRHKLRPIPFARRQFLEQEVERLLAIGAISPADPGACPYASRTVLAQKKDGTLRMCVDYRDLNAQTEKDAFPLPRIDQVWPVLAKAKYFASLDLLMGYHQVGMEPKDRYKTAFLTHRGLYVYNVMPFGLCNAPATFQRLMEKVLGPLVGQGVLVYLDDVLLYTESPEELVELLRKVLKLLGVAGLKCKASKCFLFTEQIQYLGHIVSREGIRPEPVKLDKISQWPRPETGVGLAGFLGLCNYYRELVPAFAHASDDLYKLSKTKSIIWTSELTAKFEELKSLMLSAPVVRLPVVEHDFILETDASRVAVGAVLKQRFLDTGLEHPVGFFSRALTGSERNYGAYELEMYAVVRAVEHFRMFLLGRDFLLRTDHAALGKLLRRDLPPTSRVERWILRLSEYVFRIEHKPGVENVIADVLSRLPFASSEQTPQGAAISKETKQIGEHLRGRSCDFKHVNSTQNSTMYKPPTSASSAAAHQSSTRLESERNSALNAPVERSCARSVNKAAAKNTKSSIPTGGARAPPSEDDSSTAASKEITNQFNSNQIKSKDSTNSSIFNDGVAPKMYGGGAPFSTAIF